MSTHCMKCRINPLSKRQISLHHSLCTTCYQDSQVVTRMCLDCRNLYTSAKIAKYYCDRCAHKHVERERERERRDREWDIELQRREDESRRRNEEYQQELAAKIEQDRLTKEREYNEGIDKTCALDHRTLCKMIYDMHLVINHLDATVVALQEKIDDLENHAADDMIGKCVDALRKHNLIDMGDKTECGEED